MMADDAELEFLAAAGRAALIPGMQHAFDIVQRALDEMRTKLAAAQGRMAMAEAPRGRGRPRKAASEPAVPKDRAAAARSGWPADPEERKREMARRMAKRKSSNLGEQRKADWAALSPQKRRQRLAAMEAGKEKARRARRKAERAEARPVVTLEKTA